MNPGELNPSEISERQRVSRNTMSAFIRNLEDEGWWNAVWTRTIAVVLTLA